MTKRVPLALCTAILIASMLPTIAFGTPTARKVVVAVDLSHGESSKYLTYIMGNITWVNWKQITTLSAGSLDDVDMFIVGQPTVAFTPAELSVLTAWLNLGGKVLWAAGDSDYPPGNTYTDIANLLLQTANSKLRIDLCSVEDPIQNCGGAYRVVGNVTADPEGDEIELGIKYGVLYHGPAILAYTLSNGSWAGLETTQPTNVVRVVWTSVHGKIVESSEPIANAHTAGQNGSFVLLAAEFVPVGQTANLIIASGESPYGDYEPTWASNYKGVPLDGPAFVHNMITWALRVRTVWAGITLQRQLNQQITALQADKTGLQTQVSSLNTQISTLQTEKMNNLYMGLGGGLVAGLVVGFLVAYLMKKK